MRINRSRKRWSPNSTSPNSCSAHCFAPSPSSTAMGRSHYLGLHPHPHSLTKVSYQRVEINVLDALRGLTGAVVASAPLGLPHALPIGRLKTGPRILWSIHKAF